MAILGFHHVGISTCNLERSVAFYHHLGFRVQEVAKYRDRLSWASLESDRAEIMLEGTHGPPDPDRQRVQFYLYSQDLAALCEQLHGAGLDVGPIENGPAGQEMRVADPDGYVLIIAQIE